MTGDTDPADSHELPGGMMNAGAVVRRGEVVERPAPPNVRALHAYLRALRRHGFDAAPVPVGVRADGREQLEFITGDVAAPPFPRWAMSETALRSVGGLLRRLHEASAGVRVDVSAGWAGELADPEGGTMLCHNDVCPENVVFRDGRAVALIDFDQAAPGRPVWDVALTAGYWVPMLDPESAAPLYPIPGTSPASDAPARLRLLADSYGLSPRERAELPEVVEQAAEVCRAFVARRVAEGNPAYVQALRDRGGWERWDRIQAWLTARREAFRGALLEGLGTGSVRPLPPP
ncbi:phosphotransferase [Streptomyces sp. AcE210]|uniref:phosphotransferase n=1 Tax=Streptomyces sp. AcE210 TaxID=2292703 RepID=UPI000E302729|nr:phosphotransferase [Streptomyces sp. AcE210]RFC70063.1 aminoglycoside phosphotransferase family protein [Streptomyces sp. AcE210]